VWDKVFVGEWLGTRVAIKSLKMDASLDVDLQQVRVADFQQEIALLRSLRHPNVVNFLGTCVKDKQVWQLSRLQLSKYGIVWGPTLGLSNSVYVHYADFDGNGVV